MSDAAPNHGFPIDELLDDRHLLEALLEHSPDHIYFKDRQGRFLSVSRSLAEWMGLSEPFEAIGRSDVDFFAPEHARKARMDEDVILNTGRALIGVEEREVWPDGRVTWVSTTKVPLRDREGRIVGIFGMSRDVTARKAAEEMIATQAAELEAQATLLRDLATRDELTGLLNRRGFLEAASRALEAARARSLRTTMFFVDLDGLKQINDSHGHHVGDQALVVVGDALRQFTSDSCLTGRIGGDEFCVLELGRPAQPSLSEHAIQDAVEAACESCQLPVALSATIGRIDATPDLDLEQLIARSDQEMYTRKGRRTSDAA